MKNILFCNGVGGSWGAGRKNVRAIRFFVKPPPPWGSLVMNPRNIATVEKIIPETNILTELAAPGDVDPLTASDAVFVLWMSSLLVVLVLLSVLWLLSVPSILCVLSYAIANAGRCCCR